MKAGRLRHRVDLQALETVHDSDGAISEEWISLFPKLSAEIMPLSGRELIAAASIQSNVQTRIKIRYRNGITTKMRIVHRGTIYNIESIIPDLDSGIRHLVLNCSSGMNEG